MKKTKIALSVLLLIAVTLGALYSYFLYAAKPAAPTLSASLQRAQIEVGDRQRDYAYYLPAKLPANAPLLFVLHGSLQTLDDMRTFSAYQFERLADEHGFILVYPQGVERNWNDCRAVADYPARQQNVDDVGLIAALIPTLSTTNNCQALGLTTCFDLTNYKTIYIGKPGSTDITSRVSKSRRMSR